MLSSRSLSLDVLNVPFDTASDALNECSLRLCENASMLFERSYLKQHFEKIVKRLVEEQLTDTPPYGIMTPKMSDNDRYVRGSSDVQQRPRKKRMLTSC